jgi:hypothetical protein
VCIRCVVLERGKQHEYKVRSRLLKCERVDTEQVKQCYTPYAMALHEGS